MPSAFVTEANATVARGQAAGHRRVARGRPGRATASSRRSAPCGSSAAASCPSVRIAYETFGDAESPTDATPCSCCTRSRATATSSGDPGPGIRPPAGGADSSARASRIDTDEWFVVAPEHARRMPGHDRPRIARARRHRVGLALPVRHHPRPGRGAGSRSTDALGIERWAAVIGGSMGGMQVARVGRRAPRPGRAGRRARRARAVERRPDRAQLGAARGRPHRPELPRRRLLRRVDGEGPYRGLALARRMALLNYRSPTELNDRFERSWQSGISPLGGGGRYAVESYLDFHGNKFTRRFDANSYLALVEAMNSHDIGRGRGGVAAALSRVTAHDPRARHRQRPALPGRRPARGRAARCRATSTATCRR